MWCWWWQTRHGRPKKQGRLLPSVRRTVEEKNQRDTLVKSLDRRSIAFKLALDATVLNFFENDVGILAKTQALEDWNRPQLPANIEMGSVMSWCKGADKCKGNQFQLRPHLLDKFDETPFDFEPLIKSLLACCEEHAHKGVESCKAVTTSFILDDVLLLPEEHEQMSSQGSTLPPVMRAARAAPVSPAASGTRASLKQEIELHWDGQMSFPLDTRLANFLEGGVLGARVTDVNLEK